MALSICDTHIYVFIGLSLSYFIVPLRLKARNLTCVTVQAADLLEEALPVRDRGDIKTSAAMTFFANKGIVVAPSQASRAKSEVVIRYQGLEDEAYSLLPGYLLRVEEDNPGSVTALDVDASTFEFRRAFISLAQSQVVLHV